MGIIKEAANILFLKDFMSFIKGKGINPETLDNDQEMWRVLRLFEEEKQQIMSKADVKDLKDFFYGKAFRTQKDLWKVESKDVKSNKIIKEEMMMRKKLNEAAMTDFTINAQVAVEGLGSGKIVLITPDSVTIKFADDTDTTFLADETYKINIKVPEAPAEPVSGRPAPVPAAATSETPGSLESVKKSLFKLIEAVKLLDTKVDGYDVKASKVKESVLKLASAVRLMNEGDAAIASGDPGVGGEGTPADDKGKIDQKPNVPAGDDVVTPDTDSKLSTPDAIAAESKRLAVKLGISVMEAFELIKKKLMEDEVGAAGAGVPADDKGKIDQVPNVPAGEEIPATNDPDKAKTIPDATTQESKRKAKVKNAIEEMKILSGVKKHSLLG